MSVVALSGGVGGAKLVDGFAAVLAPGDLTVVVNTGDDFEHLGLTICPDLDTVTYTLAGLANPVSGWGRADETWSFMETLGELGGPTWFRIGDRDLGLHIERSRRLNMGESLSEVISQLSQALGVKVMILPMSDQPVRTIVISDEGELPFQEYFVARFCEPRVKGFRFSGVDKARPAPGILEAMETANVIVLCPSNPWVSLDPILAVPGMREAVQRKPIVGVSPIVGGRVIRGPAAKMYTEMGIQPSAVVVAEHYRDILAGFVLDEEDKDLESAVSSLGIRVLVTQTIMRTAEDRQQLARDMLSFIASEFATGLQT